MPSPLTATLNNLALLYGFPNAVAHVIFCTLIPGALCAYLLQHGRPGAKTHLDALPVLVQRRPGPVGEAPGHKMERQRCGHRRRLRAIALRQALPHAAVHLHPLQLSQPCSQDLAIERMLKPVAPTEGPVWPLC